MIRTSVKVGIVAAVAALVASAPVGAQTSFEGAITFTVAAGEQGGGGGTFVQTTKGALMRIDTQRMEHGQPMTVAVIIDAKAHSMTMLMPEQKMYMSMDMKMADSAAGDAEHEKEHADVKASLEKTDRTETVAGVTCTIYKGSRTTAEGTREGEACMAKGVGFAVFDAFMRGPRASHSTDPSIQMFRALAKEDMRALKVWKIADGQRVVVMETTKIDRSPVPASAFAIPAGFMKMDMSRMGGGMHPPPQR